MQNVNWLGVGAVLAAVFAIGAMLAATGGLFQGMKGQSRRTANTAGVILVMAVIFGLAISGRLVGIGSDIASFFFPNSGTVTPGFVPGGQQKTDPPPPQQK